MSGIVWLASYPKSGNTWLRVFLTNLFRDEAADINDLSHALIASDRAMFENALGYDSDELTIEELQWLRPQFYKFLRAVNQDGLYIKIHDAIEPLPGGLKTVGHEDTQASIYVMRNPLDVCVSFAHFMGHKDMDRMIAIMADDTFKLAGEAVRRDTQLPQPLKSWSNHVLSWVDASDLNVHVMRYEDMRTQPLETFTAMTQHLNIKCKEEHIHKALAFSDFKRLKNQEKKKGFGENPMSNKAFFRSGRTGGWRDVLTDSQVERLISDHRAIMRRFGYIDQSDNPLY